ncbi:MAG: hypothetical protein ABSB88_27375, partial [Bryobacteraceae bacterium]
MTQKFAPKPAGIHPRWYAYNFVGCAGLVTSPGKLLGVLLNLTAKQNTDAGATMFHRIVRIGADKRNCKAGQATGAHRSSGFLIVARRRTKEMRSRSGRAGEANGGRLILLPGIRGQPASSAKHSP